MQRLSSTLLRKSSLTIYKSFARPNLDYANAFYEKLLMNLSKKKEKKYRNGSRESSYLNYWCNKGSIL